MDNLAIRDIRETPFVYQSIFAIRRIREGCSSREFQNVLAVYVVLCEICTNKKNDEIETYISSIAIESRLSDKTTSKCLEKLANLFLITYPPQEKSSDGKYKARKIALLSMYDPAKEGGKQGVNRKKKVPTAEKEIVKLLSKLGSLPEEVSEKVQRKFRESSHDETSDIRNLLIEPSYRTLFKNLIREVEDEAQNSNKKDSDIYVENYNRIFHKKHRSAESITKNLEHWRKIYSMEEIVQAMENIALSSYKKSNGEVVYWKDIVSLELILRTRNPQQEAVNYIDRFLQGVEEPKGSGFTPPVKRTYFSETLSEREAFQKARVNKVKEMLGEE